jgi:AAA+ superfamily predicted ATPase
MTDKVVIFTGSKRDFDTFLDGQIGENEETIPFMELIQYYNARLRPNESGVGEEALSTKIRVDNCVVRSDDYGSVLPHVLSNFTNIVTLNHDIGTLYVQNPPRRVMESLRAGYGDEIEYHESVYPELTRETLAKLYSKLNEDVLGQEECKRQILSGMYRLTTGSSSKPVVLMLYGPSGVGKTESAKSISKTLGGELLRVQFSMMQTQEAYDYVFGAEHSKSSFARDMMGRESNVILIDEFDKVNPLFYNAFYELFDEGRYVDTNYSVCLGQVVFLLTCNFGSESEIKKILGPAMFSRIGCCIEYADLSTEQKQAIVGKWYKSVVETLEEDERMLISETNILEWFLKNAERYDNIRILKTKLENAIFEKLTDHFIIKVEGQEKE